MAKKPKPDPAPPGEIVEKTSGKPIPGAALDKPPVKDKTRRVDEDLMKRLRGAYGAQADAEKCVNHARERVALLHELITERHKLDPKLHRVLPDGRIVDVQEKD
ncbi:MAG: hypothetical protein M5U26_08515 [Planctomycetota bacterium]|nr:hypothetical protein [Planctomycetota bacterium]